MRIRSRLFLVFTATLSMAVAQTTSGSIAGSVVDPAGAPVAGATVTVKNMETNAISEAKTRVAGVIVIRKDLTLRPLMRSHSSKVFQRYKRF